MAVLALVLAMAFSSMTGPIVLTESRFPVAGGPHVLEFTVTRPGQLVQVSVGSPVRNTWMYYGVSITSQGDGEDVAEFGREVSYYSGYDGGRWSEGSQSATARFHLPAGSYRASFVLEEADATRGSLRSLPHGYDRREVPNWFWVRIREGIIDVTPLLVLAVVFGIFAVSVWGRRQYMERRRWGDLNSDD